MLDLYFLGLICEIKMPQNIRSFENITFLTMSPRILKKVQYFRQITC